jgi:hypothetical protein
MLLLLFLGYVLVGFGVCGKFVWWSIRVIWGWFVGVFGLFLDYYCMRSGLWVLFCCVVGWSVNGMF